MSSVNAGGSPIKAYSYEKSETAQTLKNSKGSEKSRVHLLSYNGAKGQDRYAVAAERMDSMDDTNAKLGWLDRKYYVLHKHIDENNTTTWYKINKNSLKKRLDISSKELDLNKETGVVGDKLEKLVATKQAELDLLNKYLKPNTPFEEAFVQELLAAGIDMEPYGMASLYASSRLEGSTLDFGAFELYNYSLMETPKPWLMISYADKDPVALGPFIIKHMSTHPDKSAVKYVRIDKSAYEAILAGKPIPKAIIDQIDPKLGLYAGTLTRTIQDKEMKFDFNAETRRSDIKKWLDKVSFGMPAVADDDTTNNFKISGNKSNSASKLRDLTIEGVLTQIGQAKGSIYNDQL